MDFSDLLFLLKPANSEGTRHPPKDFDRKLPWPLWPDIIPKCCIFASSNCETAFVPWERYLLRPSLVLIDNKRRSSIKTKKRQEKEGCKKHESRRKTGVNGKSGVKGGTEENEENSKSGQSGHRHFRSKSFSNSQVYESHTIGIFLSSLGIYSTPSHKKSILLQAKQNNKNVSVND